MNIKKHSTHIVILAFYLCNHSLLQADVFITNKTENYIDIRPTFTGIVCNTHPCPGEIRISPDETGVISTKNKTLERIIATDKKARKKSTMDFAKSDNLQNQDVYLTFESGELK